MRYRFAHSGAMVKRQRTLMADGLWLMAYGSSLIGDRRSLIGDRRTLAADAPSKDRDELCAIRTGDQPLP